MKSEILKIMPRYICCPQDYTPTLIAYYIEVAYWDNLISESQRDEYLDFIRNAKDGILSARPNA